MNTDISYKHATRHYSKNLFSTMRYFRHIALEVDKFPDHFSKHIKHHGIEDLCFDRVSSCLLRTKKIEALAYGDPGVLLACPGPSLAGLMLRELGSSQQKEMFFNYVEQEKATTFLAVTEPRKGSDVSELQTRLNYVATNQYELYGSKYLVGHGADAPIGVLLARTSNAHLGLAALLITPDMLSQREDKLTRKHLAMVGLKGARLSELHFNGLPIAAKNILGHHLSPLKRGMMALIKTFNQMRPAVAAIALGHAQAVLDYVRCNIYSAKWINAQVMRFETELMATRLMLYKAAAEVDKDSMQSTYASLVKLKSSTIAEKIITFAASVVSNQFEKHPLIFKWMRDVYGYEYMEGTSYMQLKNIYQGYSGHKLQFQKY